MIKIRINNEINLSWTVYRLSSSGKFPEDFRLAKIVEMYIFDNSGMFRYSPAYTIVDGTFRMTFPASRQKQLGEYNLYLQYVKNGNTYTVDSCKAFELVSETCKQTIGTGDTVELETQVDLLPSTILDGVTSYDDLTDKPKINGTELVGEVTLQSLGITVQELGIDSVIDESIVQHNQSNLAHPDIRDGIRNIENQVNNVEKQVKESEEKAIYQSKHYTDQQIASIPVPDVSGQISIHNQSVQSHLDIRQSIIDCLSSSKIYTDNQIAKLIGTAPEMLDTIEELAKAIQDGGSAISSLNDAIVNKLGKQEAANLYVSLQEYVAFSQQEKEKLAQLENYNDAPLRQDVDRKIKESSDLLVPKEGYFAYSQEEKERLATIVEPTFFLWLDGMYQTASTPQDFNRGYYQIVACAFSQSNPVDNPVLKIDGMIYPLLINNQPPLKERISTEEICFIWFVNNEARIFGLDSNRATVDEALSGEDKNKYITPETLSKSIDSKLNIDKMALFIDMWNSRCSQLGNCGKYNASTKLFELNGILDIGYDEAMRIWSESAFTTVGDNFNVKFMLTTNIRTVFPLKTGHESVVCTILRAFQNSSVEVVQLKNSIRVKDGAVAFYDSKISKIIGTLNMDLSPSDGMFSKANYLTDCSVYKLKTSYSFSDCSALSNYSILYMVTNAVNTTQITITLHRDAYARATADEAIVAEALGKNIILASA